MRWFQESEEQLAAERTLDQLGVPRQLASDLEAALKAVGAAEGGRVSGFRFETADGVRHRLVLTE
ncbi:MAG TPA: hypothetical protein VFP50_19065 [Anaeromyxobacteraceae bacterium]|nr:hypothetical protein [Anaeromyxobacteraceae bacterium]